MLDNLFRDLRHAFRMFAQNPAATAIIVVTLALAIAANTAVFSVISAIFLRPLPGIADPGSLVSLYRIQNTQTFDNLGYPDYRDYRDRNQSLRGLAAHSPLPLSFAHESSERVIGDLVTGNYFDILGVKPAAGRLLAEEDDAAVVISYALWQHKFGGSRDAVGARIELNGYPFTIVGIGANGFRGTMLSLPLDVWAPLHAQPRLNPRLSSTVMENRASGWLMIFGRLKLSLTVAEADSEIKTIAAQLAQAYPVTNDKRSARLAAGVGTYPDDRAEVSSLLVLLSGAVALLLLIACANVTGMLLLRSIGRTREMAIRLATGATPRRLVAQLLTEGCVLSLMGGGLGILLAAWATQAIILSSQGGTSLLLHSGAGIDTTVFAFALAASIATGILVSLAPATQSLKVDLTDSLKSGSAASGFKRARMRGVLVSGQVALSLVLLASGVLLLKGLYRSVTANPGFDASNVAMAAVDLNLERYSEERGRAFYRDSLGRLKAMPGVVAATAAFSVPPTEWPGAVSIFHPGQEPSAAELQGREFELGLRVNINHIAPDYFRTLGIALLQGRDFTDRDAANAPGAVIVSESLARKMWPGENAIGKRIVYPMWQGPRRPPFEVIGVAQDVKHLALTREAPLLMYVSVLQEYDGRARILVRTTSNPAAGIAMIQRAVAATDKNIAVYSAETGRQHSADSLWQQRMAASWIAAFGGMALLLAAIGLHAVVAQSVAERVREVGIRIALGASPRSVAALVIKQGMLLALAGVAMGIPAALLFNRLVESRVAAIRQGDAWGLTAIALLLMSVTLASCWIPARRAARIDPARALRS